MLEQFLMDRAKKSIKFAHLIFWYLIAGLDDNESIQMSQHKYPQTWEFLNKLVSLWDNQTMKLEFEATEEFKASTPK